MKILMMVLHLPPAAVGGAEYQCLRQARALVARGHEVTILTQWLYARSPRREMQAGVEIRRCGFCLPGTTLARGLHDKIATWRKSAAEPIDFALEPAGTAKRSTGSFRWMSLAERPGKWSFIAEVQWLIRSGRLKGDVVHSHESHWLAGLAQWAAEQMGVPVFCKETFQPVLLFCGATDVPHAEEWQTRRRECGFIAMSAGIARDLQKEGIPPGRIVEIPNGVDIPVQIAEPGRHPDALYVGNFTQGSAHKGFDILLQALGKARRAEPGLKLHLYGSGDSRVWRSYARQQGCGDSAIFEGRTDDIWAAHRRCGYLILPSRKEGLSNALIEAMASGLPAIVSDIEANRMAIQDGQEGLIVPVDDVPALAEAMVKMHRFSDLRATMGQAARARVEKQFAIDKIAEQLEHAYQQAIDRRVQK
mgnify:CR=1 FL=1